MVHKVETAPADRGTITIIIFPSRDVNRTKRGKHFHVFLLLSTASYSWLRLMRLAKMGSDL
jgi:5-hydroxyisourate hydrolase-like protein (transthyretin family)